MFIIRGSSNFSNYIKPYKSTILVINGEKIKSSCDAGYQQGKSSCKVPTGSAGRWQTLCHIEPNGLNWIATNEFMADGTHRHVVERFPGPDCNVAPAITTININTYTYNGILDFLTADCILN